jgi:putative PEP-CTERM system TPR-repeat lipoprotein
MNYSTMKCIKLAAILSIAIGLFACSEQKTTEEYIASAKLYRAELNYTAAIIELKNAVKLEPKNPMARFQLGSTYIDYGQPLRAEKELERASALNYQNEQLFVKLAKIKWQLGKYEAVDNLLKKADKFEDETHQAILYYAFLVAINKGDKERAEDHSRQSTSINADNGYAKMGRAWLAYYNNDLVISLQLVAAVLSNSADFYEALNLKGHILQQQANYSTAAQVFEQISVNSPNLLPPMLSQSYNLILSQDFDAAQKVLNHLLKRAIRHPKANYYQSLLSFVQNDFVTAKKHAENALNSEPNYIAARLIAGISAYRNENLEQAYTHLVRVVPHISDDHPVKSLFTHIQLDLGYLEGVVDKVENKSIITRDETSLYLTSIQQMMLEGGIEKSITMMKKVDYLEIDNAKNLAISGAIKLNLSLDDGIEDLEKANLLSDSLPYSQIALMYALVKEGKFDQAIANTKKWQKNNPRAVFGYNMEGVILKEQGKFDQAQKVMEKALEINANNPASLIFFADQAIRKGQQQKAVEHLLALLKYKEDHLIGLKKLGKLYVTMGNSKAAVDLMLSSYQRNEHNLNFFMLYVKALYADSQFLLLTNVLEEKAEFDNLTNGAVYWLLLGNSYQAMKDKEKAIDTFKKWSTKTPGNALASFRLVHALFDNNNYSEAIVVINNVIKKNSDISFKLLKVRAFNNMFDFENAQLTINRLTKEEQELPSVTFEQGKLFYGQKLYKKALFNLEKHYSENPTSLGASLIAESHRQLGQVKQSEDFLSQHLESNRNDNRARIQIAQLQMDSNLPKAIEQYQYLLTLSPNHYLFLNNISYAYMLNKQLDLAEKFADKAVLVAGEQPNVLHTAGIIALKQHKVTKAIQLLEKAAALLTDNELIAKDLALALKQRP